jgi:hypothetical protein
MLNYTLFRHKCTHCGLYADQKPGLILLLISHELFALPSTSVNFDLSSSSFALSCSTSRDNASIVSDVPISETACCGHCCWSVTTSVVAIIHSIRILNHSLVRWPCSAWPSQTALIALVLVASDVDIPLFPQPAGSLNAITAVAVRKVLNENNMKSSIKSGL